MKALRRSVPFTMIVLLAILLAACGSATTTPPKQAANGNANNGYTTTGKPAVNTTPAANGQMDMMQGIMITPDMAGDQAALIHLGMAAVNGNQVKILMTNKGFPVYTYKDDTALMATCTADCAKDWPAVLAAAGMMTVTSAMALPKQLSVHQTPNGAQVFYDGHALYTDAADKKAGQAVGNGDDMKWYLVDSMIGAVANANTGAANTGAANTGAANTGAANMMTQGITITPDMAGDMNAFIHTGKAAINGNQVNVLTMNNGFALYYYKDDTAFTATCTADCAKDWPPLLAPQGMMTISSSVKLPKQLSVHQTPNGAQVFYDGHALYGYATDTQAGQALGRGQDTKWYLVGFLL